MERPYQRPVPGLREVRTPHHPGGGGVDAAGARAHTHVKGTSNTLQCWVTVSSPRHIVTSTPPKEWMVRPSPTLMATVLVFLKVFSRRRATIESVAPVSSTARKT